MPDILTMVLCAVGAAIAAVAAALWPLISSLLKKLIDNQERFGDLADGYLLLARAYAAGQTRSHDQDTILVIEDTMQHRKLIQGLLAATCLEAELKLAIVSTIDDALIKLPRARILICDVVLGGADETQQLNRVIGLVPESCDVIINAAGDYPRELFPQVAVVLKKWGDGANGRSELVESVRKCLHLDRLI